MYLDGDYETTLKRLSLISMLLVRLVAMSMGEACCEVYCIIGEIHC